MCRLFAVKSSAPTEVHRPLVVEANALRHQSREHPHGWGIAFYTEGSPQLTRGVAAAHEDENFERCSRGVSSPTVIAHVRKASVGPQTLENTHPFVHGPWVLAHNGTIPDFDSVRAEIEALIAPAYRTNLRGETDSERIFALVLTSLERRGDLLRKDFALQAVLDAMEEAVRVVMTACAHFEKQPSLNLVLSNGQLLASFRHGRTLFYSTLRSFDDQDPPVVDLAPAVTGSQVAHLVISSERIGAPSAWHEVPEDTFVAIDERMHLVQRALSNPLPGSGDGQRRVA